MVTIKIEDEWAELMPQTQVDISFKSPVFDADHAARNYSLPHRIAASPVMLTRLKNMHRLDTTVDSKSLIEKIYIDHQFLDEGVFEVEKVTPQYMDGHFANNVRQYVSDLGNTQLYNLLPIIEIPQTLRAHWGFVVDWAQNMAGKFYSMYINGSTISYTAQASDTPLTVSLYFVNKIQADFGIPANNTYSRIDIFSNGEIVRLHPWASELQGLHLQADWLSFAQARQQNFTNFIKECFDNPRDDISFGFMKNPKFYDNKNLQWVGEINSVYKVIGSEWVPNKNAFIKITEESVATKGHWEYNYVPFVRVRYILKLIAQSLDLADIGGDFDEWIELMSDLVVYNFFALDEVLQEWQFDISNNTEAEKAANVCATKIDLKNHMPDMSARDFLKDFCETFNLYWDIVNGRLFFKKKDNLLTGQPSAIIQSKLVPNSIERSYKKRQGLSLNFKRDESDIAIPISPYSEGDGKTDIVLPSGILAENFLFQARCCYAEQIGNSGLSKTGNTLALRFMLDKGVQFRSNNLVQYVQTATENKDSSGGLIGAVSLAPSAIYEWAWHELARLKANGFPISFKVDLDINQIQKIKTWDTALYRIQTPDGSAVVAIDELSVSGTLTEELKETKVTGLCRY